MSQSQNDKTSKDVNFTETVSRTVVARGWVPVRPCVRTVGTHGLRRALPCSRPPLDGKMQHQARSTPGPHGGSRRRPEGCPAKDGITCETANGQGGAAATRGGRTGACQRRLSSGTLRQRLRGPRSGGGE